MLYLRRLTSRLLLGTSLLVGLVAYEGRAQAGETESDSLFAEGRELRSAGKCEEAILKFRKALETFPEGLGALRNIAECETELGKFASARRDWADLKVAVLQSNQPKYLNPPNGAQGLDKDAEQAQAQLAQRVAKVTIKVNGERPEGMSITVNGKPFDLGLIGIELEEDDGPLTVEIQYGASQPLRQNIEVKEKARETIEMTIPAGAAEAAKKKHGPPETSNAGPAMRIGGGIALAVAGLGAIGAAASAGIRQAALSDIKKTCPTLLKCNPSLQSDYDRGKAANTAMIATAITAGVGLAVGIPLIVASPKSHPSDAALDVGIGPLYGGAAVGVGGRF